MPHLQQFYQRYKARGLRIIALEAYGMDQQARAFIAEQNLTYTFLSSGGTDRSPIVFDHFGITSFPTTWLLDADGRIMFVHDEGYSPQMMEQMAGEIEVLLN